MVGIRVAILEVLALVEYKFVLNVSIFPFRVCIFRTEVVHHH